MVMKRIVEEKKKKGKLKVVIIGNQMGENEEIYIEEELERRGIEVDYMENLEEKGKDNMKGNVRRVVNLYLKKNGWGLKIVKGKSLNGNMENRDF